MSETLSDVDARKAMARVAAFAARAAAHAAGAGAARRAAGHALRAIAGLSAARTVAGYMPIRSEIDPMPAMMALYGLGYEVCVPVIEGPGQALRFRQWKPEIATVAGPFGVPVPEEGDWLEPDALLVPLLSFDPRGNRLGYGGGFYDRTLCDLRARKPVAGIGLAYEGQMVPEVPCAEVDAVLDAVATEESLRRTA